MRAEKYIKPDLISDVPKEDLDDLEAIARAIKKQRGVITGRIQDHYRSIDALKMGEHYLNCAIAALATADRIQRGEA